MNSNRDEYVANQEPGINLLSERNHTKAKRHHQHAKKYWAFSPDRVEQNADDWLAGDDKKFCDEVDISQSWANFLFRHCIVILICQNKTREAHERTKGGEDDKLNREVADHVDSFHFVLQHKAAQRELRFLTAEQQIILGLGRWTRLNLRLHY